MNDRKEELYFTDEAEGPGQEKNENLKPYESRAEEQFSLDTVKFSGKSGSKILDNEKEYELTNQMYSVLNNIRNKTLSETEENDDNEFMNLGNKSSPGKESPRKVDAKQSPGKFTEGYVSFSSTSGMRNVKNLRLDPETLPEYGYEDPGRKQNSEIILLLDDENGFKGSGGSGLGKRAQPCANELMEEGLGSDMQPRKYLVTIPVFKL